MFTRSVPHRRRDVEYASEYHRRHRRLPEGRTAVDIAPHELNSSRPHPSTAGDRETHLARVAFHGDREHHRRHCEQRRRPASLPREDSSAISTGGQRRQGYLCYLTFVTCM